MKDDFSFGIIPFHKESKRFLLIRHLKDHWSFPKGHAENNETHIESAARELLEETGLKVSVIDNRAFTEAYSFIKKGVTFNKKVTYFIGFIEDTNVTTQEHEVDNFAWLLFDDALSTITYESAQLVLKEAVSYLKANNKY